VKTVINHRVLSIFGNFLSTLHTVGSLRNAPRDGDGSVLPVTDEYRQEDNIHHHHHHLPPWIRSFDLFRHRRIAIVSWGVYGLFFLDVCS